MILILVNLNQFKKHRRSLISKKCKTKRIRFKMRVQTQTVALTLSHLWMVMISNNTPQKDVRILLFQIKLSLKKRPFYLNRLWDHWIKRQLYRLHNKFWTRLIPTYMIHCILISKLYDPNLEHLMYLRDQAKKEVVVWWVSNSCKILQVYQREQVLVKFINTLFHLQNQLENHLISHFQWVLDLLIFLERVFNQTRRCKILSWPLSIGGERLGFRN